MRAITNHRNLPGFPICVPMVIFMFGVFASSLCSAQEASTAEIQAPLESMRIKLSPDDAPVNVTLKQWFCHALDDQEDRLNVQARVFALTKESVQDRVNPNTPADPFIRYVIYARNNWGYKPDAIFSAIIKSELRQSRIMKRLDAPKGETRTFRKRNCYTADDVKAFIRQVANGVTGEMTKIIALLRAPPYELTKRDFRKAGWFSQPPGKFQDTQFKHHTIVISLSRASKKKKNDSNKASLGKKRQPPPAPAPDSPDAKVTEQANAQASFPCSFDGEWSSDWGNMVFHQNGASVQATYTHDAGKIDGTVSGAKLTGYWTEAPSYNIHSHDGGDVRFTLSADCKSFSGQWRYGTRGDWLGAWSAKRKAGSAHAPGKTEAAVVKKSPKELLQDQLKDINASGDELFSLRQQWQMYSDQIDEQRAKGNDVTALKQNLMRIHVKRQQTRKRLVALTKKYGTPEELQQKIDALAPEKIPSPSSQAPETSPSSFPDIHIPGVPRASDFDFGRNKKNRDKPAKGGGSSTKPLLRNYTASKHAPLATKQSAIAVRWTVYKVKTLSRRARQLPNINVIKIAFKKSASRAALIVKTYPVSLVRNMNGTVLWSVNWRNGDIEESRMANQPGEILKLERDAEQRKSGSVSEKQLDTLIGNTIGPKSMKKK